jgi:putative Holliday junction resolvase
MPILEAEGFDFREHAGKGRALGLDYGDKRIGLAISDNNWKMSFPLAVLQSHGVFRDLFRIIEEREVSVIVVGNPLSLSGYDHGAQNEKVKKFVRKLMQIQDLNIVLWDERFSSIAAQRSIEELQITSRGKQKAVIDKVAASFILQGFLDSRK